MSDLTVIYITANEIPPGFNSSVIAYLSIAIGKDTPFISVSKKLLVFTNNIVVDIPRSHVNIYRQALIGVKAAETKYIAIAEDDIFYSPEHFKKRPTRPNVFAYNIACWSIYTWSKPPIFSYTGRRNHGMLICERDLYIKAMEERFAKFTDDSQIDNSIWAEPGKYERQLGVTVQESEVFYTDPACVMFSHPQGLSHNTLGERKRLAPIRAYEIPHWGRAEEVVKLYDKN
jgi:hypothetical protein